MTPGTIVLLHSPLLGAAAWGLLPDELALRGVSSVVVNVTDDEAPPYAMTYVARAAQQISAAGPRPPVVLVGHSGAGPLLAQVGFAQRAAPRAVGGYVFLDAGLPRAGASRLDLMRTEDGAFATELEKRLAAGERFPNWSDEDLQEALPDPAARRLVRAEMRARGLGFFTESLPVPEDWPDAPCGYLRTSEAYAAPARSAAARGWPCITYDAGHFPALTDAGELANRLLELTAML